MKIAILGHGYVGKAMEKMFKEKYKTLVYDPAKKYSVSKREINKCDLGVVCVPTPMDKKKGFPYPCNIDIIDETISWLKTPVIMIKSTVTPGTTDALKKKYGKRIVMSPEYIGETSYSLPENVKHNDDAASIPWHIIGGDDKDVSYCFDILSPIIGPKKDYYTCSAKEAELIKYMENTYFGVKVAFANEMYEICKKAGVNWYRVWQGWALDNRADRMHTAVFINNRGFDGKCLPKDINALANYSESIGYQPKLIKSALESNKEIRIKNKFKCDY